MKRFIIKLLLIIPIFFGCSSKTEKTEKDELNNSGLNLTDKQIISNLKTYVSSKLTNLSRSGSEYASVLITSINNSDDYNLELYPMYKFDTEFFYTNPSPETLIKAIKKSSDRKVYIGKKKDGDQFDMIRIEAQMYDGNWIPGGAVHEWGKVVKRFENKSMQKFDIKNMKVFEFSGKEYIILELDGENKIYDLYGELLKIENLCEYFLDVINIAKQWDGNPGNLRPM